MNPVLEVKELKALPCKGTGMISVNPPRFQFGQVVATPGAIAALKHAEQTALELLSRHVAGDWGVVDAEDAAANDEALKDGSRILSSFLLKSGEKLWVITEAVNDDGIRTSTCLLQPQEY